MKLKLLILIQLLFLTQAYSQNKYSPQSFRLPPEVKLKTKHPSIVDLSYKLTNNEKPHDYSNITNTYDKRYDLNNLSKYESNPELQAYLKEAAKFFNAIKPKFRSLYSDMELWYIYIYDVNLSKQLIL